MLGVTGLTYARRVPSPALLSPPDPSFGPALTRTLATWRQAAGMEVAFGGRVLPQASGIEITELCGARTRSLVNLVVRPGAGLGGKSLTLRRPVSVSSYFEAQGITHVYDQAVRSEHLETVVALPVLVDGAPRALVYLASRARVELGDRFFDELAPLRRRLERDIAVDDGVRRQLALLGRSTVEPATPGLSRADALDIAAELADLVAVIDDDGLRDRVERVRRRITGDAAAAGAEVPVDLGLTPREVDVVRQIARGRSTREAAEALDLQPGTVKTYLKTAMRKLHAGNRVQAVTAARRAGLVD